MPPAHQHMAAGVRPGWDLGDIFRTYGEAYRQAHPLPLTHLKVMRAARELSHRGSRRPPPRVRELRLPAPSL